MIATWMKRRVRSKKMRLYVYGLRKPDGRRERGRKKGSKKVSRPEMGEKGESK